MNKYVWLAFIVIIAVLITSDIYFITGYKRVVAERDKVIAENKTLQEAVKNPKIVYRTVKETGKVTIVEREMIKITTHYITIVTTVTTPVVAQGTYGQKYTDTRPWWEKGYGIKIEGNVVDLPPGYEMDANGVIIYREKTTIKEPGRTETSSETKPALPEEKPQISENKPAVAPVNQDKPELWNGMMSLKTGPALEIGAGININKYSVGLSIEFEQNKTQIGIYGIKKFK